MSISFHPKRLFKLLSIGIVISFSLSDISSLNKQFKAEQNFIAASEMVKNSKNEKAQIKFKKSYL